MPDVAAFLLNNLQVGGSELKTVRLVNELRARGWPVHLLYLNGPHVLRDRLDHDVQVTCLDRAGKFSLGAVLKLRTYILEQSVSTLLAVNLYPQLYVAAARALSAKASVRNLVAINTSEFSGIRSQLKMQLYGPLLRRADGLIFGSLNQQNMWARTHGLDVSRCEVIYNGVDAHRFSAADVLIPRDFLRGRFGLKEEDLVIGTVGRLQPEKNQQQLILAIKRLKARIPTVRALIVGEGRERAALQHLASSLGIEASIVFAGRLDDVRPALLAMDIFVLPSLSVETFSNAALEAMAMGLPVVLTDIGGAREMIEDGVSGFVCARGPLDPLVARIEDLATDPVTRARFGERARKRVERLFSTENMVARFERLLGFT